MCLTLFPASALVHAADGDIEITREFRWTGGGTDTNWTTPANWDRNNGYPGDTEYESDLAIFSTANAAVTIDGKIGFNNGQPSDGVKIRVKQNLTLTNTADTNFLYLAQGDSSIPSLLIEKGASLTTRSESGVTVSPLSTLDKYDETYLRLEENSRLVLDGGFLVRGNRDHFHSATMTIESGPDSSIGGDKGFYVTATAKLYFLGDTLLTGPRKIEFTSTQLHIYAQGTVTVDHEEAFSGEKNINFNPAPKNEAPTLKLKTALNYAGNINLFHTILDVRELTGPCFTNSNCTVFFSGESSLLFAVPDPSEHAKPFASIAGPLGIMEAANFTLEGDKAYENWGLAPGSTVTLLKAAELYTYEGVADILLKDHPDVDKIKYLAAGNPITVGEDPQKIEVMTDSIILTGKARSEYEVTVHNGTASSDQAKKDDTVTITANPAGDGKRFKCWTVDSGGVTLADASAPETTFTMPANDVEVTANYENIPRINKTAVKEWVNGPENHPEIWFRIYRNIAGETPVEVTAAYNGGKKTLAPGDTSVSWTGLDQTDSLGRSYTYSIQEGYDTGDTEVYGAPANYDVRYSTEAATLGEQLIPDALVARNYYKAQGSLVLSGQKELSGRAVTEDDAFSFKLYSGHEIDEEYLLDTISIAPNTAFSFRSINYEVDLLAETARDDVGEHTYTIVEEQPATNPENGISYDESVYKLTVSVSDNGDGTLSSAVTSVFKNDIPIADIEHPFSFDFTNTYAADPVSLTLNGTKTLRDRDAALKENEFSFSLYHSSDQWVEESLIEGAIGHAASGALDLPQLSYQEDEAGDHYYILKENPSTVGGVRVSDTVYRIKVSVSDNKQGQMLLAGVEVNGVSQTVNNNTLDYGLDFENVYQAQPFELYLEGIKTLENRALALQENEFRFALFHANVSEGSWSEGTQIGESVGHKAADDPDRPGSYAFPKLTFEDGQEGTHYFILKEVTPSKVAGVSDDTHAYKIEVHVVDDNEGQIRGTDVYVDGELLCTDGAPDFSFDFTNTYTAASSGSTSIEGIKKLSGRDIKDREFTFALVDGATIIASASNIGNSFSITLPSYRYDPGRTADEDGVIYLDSPIQTFRYTLLEDNTSLPADVTGDTRSIEVNVVVSYTEGSNTLSVDISGANAQPLEAEFNNSFIPSYPIVVHNGTASSDKAKIDETVTITANPDEDGKHFTGWTVDSGGVTLADASAPETTFTMPANAVEVTANFEDDPEPDPYHIAVFRTGWRTEYYLGEKVALAARAEGGTPPYRYQFYTLGPDDTKTVLHDFEYTNYFSWIPAAAGDYRVGVEVTDAEGLSRNQVKEVRILPQPGTPLEVAVFRTGRYLVYNTGDTVALAARAEGGTKPYRYQYYAVGSDDAEHILRDYAYSNIFSWQPELPDTWQVGVRVKDAAGEIVSQVRTVEVRDPDAEFRIAVFRAGYKDWYDSGEAIPLAARAEGGRVPYRYKFYVADYDGNMTILRDYAYSNIFSWTPEHDGWYEVHVSIKDGDGKVLDADLDIHAGPAG